MIFIDFKFVQPVKISLDEVTETGNETVSRFGEYEKAFEFTVDIPDDISKLVNPEYEKAKEFIVLIPPHVIVVNDVLP